ncbi:hypothetical protein SDC9_121057 [bioreactor metagenome]|uniref:Uncharacterized protein n=1 Tax=bioreactor metagenome TaxID=1076179 RepID=A0A645CB08_9ZZZZ|nr:hypothetical protein [Erysipelotrichaceae bacterium]
MMKKNDMNLYERYRIEKKVESSHTSPVRFYFAVLISVILITAAVGVKLFVDNMLVKDKIAVLEEYVNKTAVVEKMDEAKSIQANINLLADIETRINEILMVIDYIPRYDSTVLNVLYYEKPSSVTYTSISYEKDMISVVFSAKYSSDASNYVLRLQHTAAFADVSYSGYTYDEGYKVYRGTIVCMLKGVD